MKGFAGGRYILLMVLCLCLSACLKSEEQQAEEVVQQFWQAVLSQDMEQAKNLVTWESVNYLNVLEQQKNLAIQGFELGELKKFADRMEVTVMLKGGEQGEISIPINTVLFKQQSEQWLVDAQQTTSSLVSGSLDSLVGEFDQLMQKSMDQLNRSLQQGAQKLEGMLQEGIREFNENLQNRQQQKEDEVNSPPGQAI